MTKIKPHHSNGSSDIAKYKIKYDWKIILPKAQWLYEHRSDSIWLIAQKMDIPEKLLREKLCKRSTPPPNRKMAPKEVARLKAQIPKDTRTPIQILMGEPIFERSALYRKQQEILE